MTHTICISQKLKHGLLCFQAFLSSKLLLIFKICLSGLILLSSNSFALDKITDIRFWHAPEKTRMVIDLTAGASYKIFSLENPERLVIDLKDTDGNMKNVPEVNSKLIRGIRVASRERKNARIVIDLRHKLKMEHFALAPQKPYGHRIVVDLFVPEAIMPEEDPVLAIIQKSVYEQKNPQKPVDKPVSESKPEAQQKPVSLPEITARRDVIVAVDAGHGGEDPGAIGKGKTYEKTVVLKIAQDLANTLNAQPGVTAMLTRKGDYFVTLADRVKISHQKYKADFFVSVHADSAGNASARGGSVYVLGQRGVNRTLSLYLSEQEQAGNALGTNDSKQLSSLNKVLADLSLDGSMSHSVLAADKVIDEMKRVTHMHGKDVKYNNFQVLRNPYMPAILVETGFISNRKDEQLLLNNKHRKQLAQAISKGIIGYFKKQPPPGTYFSNLRDHPVVTHVVKRNEYLSTIAQKYNTTVAEIKSTNNLKSDSIRIGQKLTITQGLK
ncbi:MAG: N-acetylmuramoyl-L-alanine amidase [Pseudomonadota bacterium]|nr:N-acetylmuramoyl-L-alanine amidase [Pseudomonadota bacterium]